MTATLPTSTATEWGHLLPSPLLVRLLDEDGTRHDLEDFPVDLDAHGLRRMHRAMVIARRVDRQAINLTKQGELAVYASAHGQEATEVGSVFALAACDWLFPTYRDTQAIVARGVDAVDVLHQFRGSVHCGYDVRAHRIAPIATPIATQMLHAVGLAMAARTRGDGVVALAFCGDGATSEGDFHEALNFAAVFAAPTVFVVSNNQYAISVPISRQTHAPTLAHKAIGYGMRGIRVDGNDVLAVYATVRKAVECARVGDGPTLVECVTYRIEPHTNSDDQTRYRSADEVALWAARDPIARFERYLADSAILDDHTRDAAYRDAEETAASVRSGISGANAPAADDLFDHVYEQPTPPLREQRALLHDELART